MAAMVVQPMQELLEKDLDGYSFEIVQEVREKIQMADDLHLLIPEEHVRDLSTVNISERSYCKAKRVMDAVLSFLGLSILLLPMMLIAAAVYIDDPGEVIFSQYRVGMHGKRFKLYKFRTMKKSTPKYLATMEMTDPGRYITRVGRILRKTSLDEIPQLFNVLKGDMSLVGPRPLIADEFEIHAMRMRFGVYNIRPGVTGLAQINGRDQISVEEKLRWDVEYLRKFSLETDLKILLATVPKILAREGVEEGSNKQNQEMEQ